MATPRSQQFFQSNSSSSSSSSSTQQPQHLQDGNFLVNLLRKNVSILNRQKTTTQLKNGDWVMAMVEDRYINHPGEYGKTKGCYPVNTSLKIFDANTYECKTSIDCNDCYYLHTLVSSEDNIILFYEDKSSRNYLLKEYNPHNRKLSKPIAIVNRSENASFLRLPYYVDSATSHIASPFWYAVKPEVNLFSLSNNRILCHFYETQEIAVVDLNNHELRTYRSSVNHTELYPKYFFLEDPLMLPCLTEDNTNTTNPKTVLWNATHNQHYQIKSDSKIACVLALNNQYIITLAQPDDTHSVIRIFNLNVNENELKEINRLDFSAVSFGRLNNSGIILIEKNTNVLYHWDPLQIDTKPQKINLSIPGQQPFPAEENINGIPSIFLLGDNYIMAYKNTYTANSNVNWQMLNSTQLNHAPQAKATAENKQQPTH